MIHPKDRDGMLLGAIVSSPSVTQAFVLAHAALMETPDKQRVLQGILEDFKEDYGFSVSYIEPLVFQNRNARAFIRVGSRRIMFVDIMSAFVKMRRKLLQLVLGV
jgi:hypothetical protein